MLKLTSKPAAKAKPPPHNRRIFQGKLSFIAFQVIKLSYLFILKILCFGNTTNKNNTNIAGVVSVTNLKLKVV